MTDLKFFSQSKEIIEVTNIKFLGWGHDKHMEGKTHTELIKQNKRRNACYAITSMYSFSDTTKLTIIYFAYFHSIKEYRTIFWANTSDSMEVFSCKRKLQELRMTGSKLRESGKPLFQKITNNDFYHLNTYYP